ncbi:hypothetical protein THAOC_34143 [Thalassiosira oceanica]|uniref:Uncharacterized protein n=1 Tax=Thalassiosira oceanica TaxID=159749 RepID=K0R3Y9_THAOC|nr:hypothetical protein THAOC_34143 [Thalassiosira oceanica]|eukprot:EJK47160.1 hypothetical protein THAOC_34143 [Thalassiosira oceanica]
MSSSPDLRLAPSMSPDATELWSSPPDPDPAPPDPAGSRGTSDGPSPTEGGGWTDDVTRRVDPMGGGPAGEVDAEDAALVGAAADGGRVSLSPAAMLFREGFLPSPLLSLSGVSFFPGPFISKVSSEHGILKS